MAAFREGNRKTAEDISATPIVHRHCLFSVCLARPLFLETVRTSFCIIRRLKNTFPIDFADVDLADMTQREKMQGIPRCAGTAAANKWCWKI